MLVTQSNVSAACTRRRYLIRRGRGTARQPPRATPTQHWQVRVARYFVNLSQVASEWRCSPWYTTGQGMWRRYLLVLSVRVMRSTQSITVQCLPSLLPSTRCVLCVPPLPSAHWPLAGTALPLSPSVAAVALLTHGCSHVHVLSYSSSSS